MAEKRVRPLVIKLDLTATVSVSFEIIDELPRTILHLCWYGWQNIELIVMPDFEPNEYLFEQHNDKGSERWQISAWAVRDAMSKVSNLPVSDMPFRLKGAYWNYLAKKTDDDPTLEAIEYWKTAGQEATNGVFFSP